MDYGSIWNSNLNGLKFCLRVYHPKDVIPKPIEPSYFILKSPCKCVTILALDKTRFLPSKASITCLALQLASKPLLKCSQMDYFIDNKQILLLFSKAEKCAFLASVLVLVRSVDLSLIRAI